MGEKYFLICFFNGKEMRRGWRNAPRAVGLGRANVTSLFIAERGVLSCANMQYLIDPK